MKTNKKLSFTILSSAVCLLPILLSLVLYSELPDQIAIHWDNAGNPDNSIPKAIAAFGLPILFLAINLFSKIRLYHDPKGANRSRAMELFSAWTPPVLSLILVPTTLYIAMGAKISIAVIAPILVGILLIVYGNYLPKSRQNYTIGIKLPWTLHNSDNWNKTHRIAGYLYIAGGMTLIAGTYILNSSGMTDWLWLTVPIVVLLVIIPFVYSYFLYKSETNR